MCRAYPTGWYVLHGTHPSQRDTVDAEDLADARQLAPCHWRTASGPQGSKRGVDRRYYDAADSYLINGTFRARAERAVDEVAVRRVVVAPVDAALRALGPARRPPVARRELARVREVLGVDGVALRRVGAVEDVPARRVGAAHGLDMCGNQTVSWAIPTKLQNSRARSNRSRFG